MSGVVVGLYPTLSGNDGDKKLRTESEHLAHAWTLASDHQCALLAYPLGGQNCAIEQPTPSTAAFVTLSEFDWPPGTSAAQTIGVISPWIDCESEDAAFADLSMRQLDQAVRFFARKWLACAF